MVLSRSLRRLCAGALVSAAAASAVLAQKAPEEQTLPVEDIRMFAEVFGTIKGYYVDEVNDSDLIRSAIRGMVEGLDPHSSYLDARDFEDLEEATAGEFGGLGLEVTKDPSGVLVVSPIDDTPAARAGVRAGDIIVKIGEQSTSDMPLSESVKLMRGKPRTELTLTIARKGVDKPVVLRLTRDVIKIQSVRSKMLGDGIGYLRISQFQEPTTADTARALLSFSRDPAFRGLILDLRNNPGGLLNAAVGVCAALLPPGSPVVSTRGRDPLSVHEFAADARDYHTGRRGETLVAQLPASVRSVPVVVLINSASASASEIVAGALQDHKRATVLGTRSFGKGSVQTILPLREEDEETSGIKITTARYYTPSGRSIQGTGISPDIAVDDTPHGNYPSFNVRESELKNHLRNSSEEAPQDEAIDDEEEFVDSALVLSYRYRFGGEKDFPLEQARAHLLGKSVVTHEQTLEAMKKARAEKDAAQKKDAKDASRKEAPEKSAPEASEAK